MSSGWSNVHKLFLFFEPARAVRIMKFEPFVIPQEEKNLAQTLADSESHMLIE